MSPIPTKLTEDFEEDLSGLFTSGAPAAGSAAPEESLGGLPPQLAELLQVIEPRGVRGLVHGLFVDILQLLGRVERLKGVVEGGGTLVGLPRVFEALRKTAGYLLTNIETAELRVDELPEGLAQTLDVASFALSHELRRVFEQELPDHAMTQWDALRALALLENCLQQLAVTLARSFDPSLTGAALFENYRRRREESLKLMAELRAILGDVRRVEDGYGLLTTLALLSRVRRFRYESMHYLMYRDWADFERFVDALELSYESEETMKVLLHKLSCYVETLLMQIQMRAVLNGEG